MKRMILVIYNYIIEVVVIPPSPAWSSSLTVKKASGSIVVTKLCNASMNPLVGQVVVVIDI